MASVQIGVSEEGKAYIEKIQKIKGFESIPDTMQFILQVFNSRFKALRNYAAKPKDGKPAKKAAKKAPAKKAAKAKGPIARKGGGKKAAPAEATATA